MYPQKRDHRLPEKPTFSLKASLTSFGVVRGYTLDAGSPGVRAMIKKISSTTQNSIGIK